ncbi:1-deoxy-D-xylulose-5-phosphate reductoisomerase [Sutterella megalosphaeroides]|uniref:1-deoxy-D-xylulose 5-phosphate reductoisomerase n=1 Tax=Sutterella megalosphaeroides TaxID=2494234 RepID=A0A2Z6I8Y3_9BURK|nr:1-deoxy-D-xylulose-5-phosphate reductoisomerase [Sutterella megalosphaeroides]BBF22923.1 1-deoxy-D-xylulose 5-phosphate reductoisomerase [Sutterella megalosphaeroides]
MTQSIALLGATGSIGRSTLDVVRQHPERFVVHSMAGATRVEPLVEAAREFRPRIVAIATESKKDELAAALRAAGVDAEVRAGAAAVAELAGDPEVDSVVQAVVGAAGVEPTFRAARAGKRLLLANKESVVCGGALLMDEVKRAGATLLPLDSEHNAIFQCLVGASDEARAAARIVLTASGGPFRGRRDLSGITPEMAVKHPKWSMGRKISVDSATLMNKGLEVIEASWLFGFPADRIDVVVHPQSIIHSMVTFADGATIAQLGAPDMRTPIAYALGWPERMDGGVKPLDFTTLGTLTFEAPDRETFPLLDLAFKALAAGGGETIVLNAANEIAVEAFLDRRIGFTTMFALVSEMLAKIDAPKPASVEEILELDRTTRALTREAVAALERSGKEG